MKKVSLLILVVLLSGCADSPSLQQAITMQPVGFLHGAWHGLILPFAWVVSLFSESTAVYAIYNNGGWYDFGFFLGLGGFTSSVAASK